MATYITPTTGKQLPDIQPGQIAPTNGNPVSAGTSMKGPLLSGTISRSDSTQNLAGIGGASGVANYGYHIQTQSCVITQVTNSGTAGQFACPINIPAQSQIKSITVMVTTLWTGAATTFGLGSGASATAFTTSAALDGSLLGPVMCSPGSNSTQIANWDNVGTQDVQIVVLSANTGNGVATLTVEYIPQINMAS